MGDSFHLPIPSNTPHPRNKANRFTVQLPTPLELRGEWEVALTDIIYPLTNPNVKATTAIYFILPRVEGDDMKPTAAYTDIMEVYRTMYVQSLKPPEGTIVDLIDITLPRGYYEGEEALGNHIMSLAQIAWKRYVAKVKKDKTFPFTFTFDRYAHRCFLCGPKDSAVCFTNPELGELLGFIPTERTTLESKTTANPIYKLFFASLPDKPLQLDLFKLPQVTPVGKVPALRNRFPALFIYCDIVKNRIVGNTYAPLLRIVPLSGNNNEYTCKEYQKPEYFPVSRSYINTIETFITDDTGEEVNFLTGKVLVNLHFRRVQ